MTGERVLYKAIDDVSAVRCMSGTGLIRRSLARWDGHVVRYNLASINHSLTAADNGRVLGYDNSHGHHHRHFKGVSQPFLYKSYSRLLDHFIEEIRELRKERR